VSVDKVLKGHWPNRKLTFYRYDCAAYCRDANPTLVQADHRYVFMLVDEDEDLRSTRDVVGSFYPVAQTGDLSLSTSRDPAYLVAQAVLQPGHDKETAEWTRSLFRRSAISNELVGAAQTIHFLAPLLGHPSADLRREACFLLAEAMFDYQGCLSRMIADPFEDETVRYRAKKRLAGLTITQQRLHSVFMTNPDRWLAAVAGPDPEAVKDRLSVLTEHPDVAVREQAMRVLRRLAPPQSP
jgi:hypothetical protein